MLPALDGCQNCAYRIKSQTEAVDLLRDVIRTAHLRSIRGGGTLIEAKLTTETVLKLCLWEAGCEECESGEDLGNSTESDSQYDLVPH